MSKDEFFEQFELQGGKKPLALIRPAVPKVEVTCPAPGIYYDIPAAVYHSWPAISSTLLKGYAELPSTARTPYKPKEDANVGQGIHAYSLQGEAGLATECFLGPDLGKGKKDQELLAYLEAEHPTKAILPAFHGSPTPGQPIMDVLKGVDNSLRSHPKLGPVLKDSQKEVSLVWIDQDSGCTCKARLDIWYDRIIWDLKKCKDLDGFVWQIKDLYYGVQAGHYFNGAIACGLPAVAFAFVPCEAFPPYRVGYGYVEPENKLPALRAEAARLVGLVKQSITTGNWPNYRIPEHIFNLDDIRPDDLAQVY